jgi:ribosomal protein S18 acetylase RimI-like enzyme
MTITYNDTRKDLPLDQLHHLFVAVGWSGDEPMPENIAKGFMRPWLNSTLVVSAWDDKRLVGAVRVLSDTIFRSVVYDLLVDPAYHGNGIGIELVRRCVAQYPDSEWLVETKDAAGFYRKIGFKDKADDGYVHLYIPSKLF